MGGLGTAVPTAVLQAGALGGGPGAAGAVGRGAVSRRGARGPATVALAALVAAAGVAGVACAPAGGSPAGGGQTLYVADGVGGTVARLDGHTGRPLGPPLAAGPMPWQLAVGPDGGVLALSGSPTAARPLTRVGRTGAGWATHPVALTGPVREGRLAGDGGRYAVVVDRPPAGPVGPATDPAAAPPGCRLTLVDVPAGTVAATSAICGPHDLVTGLAFEGGPDGPVAYVALWNLRPRAPGEAPGAPGAPEAPEAPGPPAVPNRVLAVQAQSGRPVAEFPVAGVPGLAAVGPATGRLGRRLYVVERLSSPLDDPPGPPRGRLLGLHPTTLEVESDRPLDALPTRLVVAADGDAAYALHDHTLTRLGLDGGPDRSVALPERGLALAVTRDRVYVSSAYGPELWAFRRRDGRLVATIRVGQVATDLITSPVA
jgi:hypothetical protein